MGRDTSRGNTPTSSTTDDGLCALCGKVSICGGLGYVRANLPVGHPDFGKLFRCDNYQSADPSRKEKLRKLGNLEAFADKTFETFNANIPGLTPTQQQSLEMAFAVAQNYATNPVGWLLLEGTYGCGKTHLAAAVANTRLDKEDAVLFITTPDLLDHLRMTFGPTSEIGYDEMFDRVRNAPLLVLDDLGVENPSPWAQEKLFQLLNHRYTRELPTIITTNVDLELFDPRVRSRLLDENVIRRVRITSPDYRTPIQSREDQLSNLGMYAEMTFETFDTDTNSTPDDRANLRRAGQLAYSYAEQPQDWLVLMGGYGTGKTHLAAAIANYHQMRGLPVTFLTVPDLLDYLRLAFNPGANTSFDRRFQSVRGAPLLILDDLGTESATAWAKEKLFQILNHRYVARLPTVITTARSLDEIDERLRSRLMDKRRCAMFAITAAPYTARVFRRG